MLKYTTPEMDVVVLATDIIMASTGGPIETPKDEF